MVGTTPGMWAKYKSALKEKNPDGTQRFTDEEAIIEAEKAVNLTQNTSAIHTMSAIQRGNSAWRLATMFQDNPNKFFRLMNENAHAIIEGRESKIKAISNLFILWVVLPALFQFMSDGFRWRKDRQLQAWLLGPVNNLLVFGSIAQNLYGRIAGENYDYEPSPVLQIFEDIGNAISKANQIKGDVENPYTNPSWDDVIAMLEYAAKGIGMATGFPTPYLVQVEKAIRSGTPINLIYTEWALKDDDPDNNTKAEDAIAQLGEEKEQTEEEIAAGRVADIHDMNELENRFSSIYNSVLPSKIKSDNALVMSWAEKEDIYNEVMTIPNASLKDLIKYDSNNENIFDYYIQWQDRQKITNLADLKDFDKLYPYAYKGNISKREYELVTNYFNAKDRDAYLDKHSELNNDLRDEYLKNNPKDNALLAIWEGTELLSLDAYKEAQKLMGELDIPDKAVEFELPNEDAFTKWFDYIEGMAGFGKSNTSAKSSVSYYMPFSKVTEDNLDIFYQVMEYSLLRDEDGDVDSKAREWYRISHPDFYKYGIEQGWWKSSSPTSRIYHPSKY